MYILEPCESLPQTLLCSCEFLPLLPQSPQVFSISDLRLYFPMLELWVAQSVTWSTRRCLAGQLQLCAPHSTIHHLAGSASRHLAACPLAPLPVSATPTGLDECFFFISLVVGLPCGSIFCQFWLFFVFKLLSLSLIHISEPTRLS